MRAELRARWPAIRAALIALHILAIVVVSFPGSGKLGDRRRWKLARSQQEIALWAERLSRWGWSWTAPEFEAALWDLAQDYLAVRNTLAAPFAPYVALAGVSQTWGLFRAPTRTPYALCIDIAQDGAWITISESRSADAAYLRALLDNNRMRKQVGRTGRDPALFADVARWLGRRALADHPAATAVRVRVEQRDSLPPDALREGRTPPRRTVRRAQFRREALLPEARR